MEAEPTRFNAEDLLAQASWLGGLARRLVDDQALADDVVQDTWLAALRQPPERERPLRPWLARVARNFARQARRSENTRHTRELRSARDRDELAMHDPSPEELAARLEGQRLLVEALKELTEPYRSTVLLHCFEHRTLAEIARAQGLPEGTVRWRFKHALDDLRARLDRGHDGDRHAWALALLPLVRRSPPIGTPTLPLAMQGVISMSAFWKVCASATGVLILFVGLAKFDVLPWPLFSTGAAPLARETVEFRPIEHLRVSEPRALESQPISTEALRAAAGSNATDETKVGPQGGVSARFLDAGGIPIARVSVQCEERRLDPLPESGVDGRVEFRFAPLDRGAPASFVVHADGFAARRLSANIDKQRMTYLGDVELVPGGAVSGRVQDEHGDPIARAGLEATTEIRSRDEVDRRRYGSYSEGGVVHVSSAADGSFRLDGVAVGFVQVVASQTGKLKTFSGPVEVRAGQESHGLVLVLTEMPSSEIIRGIVLDPERVPVPRARVQYQTHGGSGDGSGSFWAGADGRFSLVARWGSSSDLIAKDPAERFAPVRVENVHGGMELELVFESVRTIEIVARSRDGSPLRNLRALAVVPGASDPNTRVMTIGTAASAPSLHAPTIEPNSSGPIEVGRAGQSVLLSIPNHEFVVEVEADEHRLWESATFSSEKAPERLEAALDRMPSLRGRVLSVTAAVPGAEITAWPEAQERVTRNGYPIRVNPTSIAHARSDAEGSFALTVRQKVRIFVRVEAEGYAPREVGPIDYDPERGRNEADVLLSQGGTIEGRVIAARGRSPAGTIVSFSRGDAHEFTLRVAEDGAFVAQRLIPGRWSVTKAAEEVHTNGNVTQMSSGPRVEIPWNVEVAEGQTTRFDVDLTHAEDAFVLTGALTIDGGPPGAWQVEAQEGIQLHAARFSKAALDPNGKFSLSLPGLGTHRLIFSGLDARTAAMHLMANVEVRGKETSWSRDLRTAELAIDGLDRSLKEGEFLAVVSWGSEDIYGFQGYDPASSAGESTLTVLAGTARIVRVEGNETDPDPRHWKSLAEIEVAPGTTTRLRLP